MRTTPRVWKIAAKAWLPVLILFLWAYLLVVVSRIINSERYVGMPTALMFGLALADHLGLLLMYFAVSPASQAMYRRNWKWPRMIPVHLVLLPAFVIIQALIYIGSGRLLAAFFHRPADSLTYSLSMTIKANWAFELIFYIAIVGGTLALFNYRRFREKEKVAAELRNMLAAAQLQSLRVQLQPHFLFNVLNTISSYIYENPDTAVKIVARLSELLRTSLDSQSRSFIPLEQEMGIVGKYLEIEQLRFSDRLRVKTTIPEETREALVPSFLLQPLVENAMRHGIAGQMAGGTVEIIARRRGDTLGLSVLDDGAGAKENWSEAPGIGLRNIKSRLESLYGRDFGFSAGNRSPGGFGVEITIPFRIEIDGPASAAEMK
jgi:two-component system, LytTR family, sensor kinase